MRRGEGVGHVMYSGDGRGNWWRTEWEAQCPEKVYLNRSQCQGVVGHKGDHWAYGASGSFDWSVNANDPRRDNIACGSTPPGHESYKNPVDMRKHHYISHSKSEKVTDPQVLAMLAQDRAPEKDASINRPV